MNTTSLEKKLVAALSDDIESSAVAALIEETKTATAEMEAEVNRIAMDPLACPDANKARGMIEVANLDLKRLRNLLPKLEQRFIQLQNDEQMTRWSNAYEKLKIKRDKAAKQFAEYPKLVAELIQLFQEAEAVDAQISDLHGQAPSGESRRLLSVELTARGLSSFSRSNPPISKNTMLPDYSRSDRMAWPIPTVPISVQFAQPASYTRNQQMPIAPQAPAPSLLHSHTANWWMDNEALKREQHEEQARIAKYYDDQARAREKREAAEERSRRRA